MIDEPVRHGWEAWTWDESVFAGTAPFYRRGRKPYAPGLADALAHALSLNGEGRLLDVGCGPGTATLIFAHLFQESVGVDPDAGMIAEARHAAAEMGARHATWTCMRAEELRRDLGSFLVVTFAQSFHWMEREKVARSVRTMLDEGGAVVQVDLWHHSPAALLRPGPHPLVPESAIDELRVKWLGPDRRAGQGFRNTSPSGEDEIFQSAGFDQEQLVVVPDTRILERTSDDVVAWVLSTSSTAPHLFGEHLPDFERELRDLLFDVSPDGHFSVPLSDNRLRIRRPR